MYDLLRQHILRAHVCSKCFGPITSTTARPEPHCPRGCTPGGFVTRAWAERWIEANEWDYLDVCRNYPALAPARDHDTAADCAALYGED